MSIIDSVNNSVVPYVSGTTKPFTGQRLIIVTYKTVTDKSSPMCNIKRESKCVSVPLIPSELIAANLVVLTPHIRGMLESVQKSIVREMLDSLVNGSVHSVGNADISLEACIEYLESSDESGRLTKESVGNWFDSSIATSLAVALADKLGIGTEPTDAESTKVMAIIAAFRRDVSALAGGKTNYPPVIAVQLKKALAYAPNDDVIASKFVARLDKMITSNESNLIDAL